jgi:LacI family transcriptional regulator, galactose operon repressor
MATMRDVAALAGVSAKTVSRVYNGDPHVTPETKERVEAALRELSYVPNTIATTFRTGRAPVIGVVVPDITDPLFASIAKAVEELARTRAMSVVITSIGPDPAREVEVVQSLLSQPLSGLIIAPVRADHAYLAPWAERLPVVFVDRQPVGLAVDSFTEDDTAGARLATEHLIGHGHTRIGFIGDDESIPTSKNRLQGYRDALAHAGLPYSEALVSFGAVDRVGAAAAFAAVDRVQQSPTALFCSNARSAISLVPFVRASGLAMATFGDFPLADMLKPAWTFIDQDPHRLGTLAAQRVLDRLDRPKGRFRRRTVLPVPLVERESCLVSTRLRAHAAA